MTLRRLRSGTGPAAARPGRPRRSVCSRAVRSVAGSGSVTPSTMFSSTARRAETGVRSSWLTLATSSRRWRSTDGEVLGHQVEGRGQLADLVVAGRPDPSAVVAPRHRDGRGGHLAQRRGHAAGQHLGDDQGEDDRQRQRVARGQSGVQAPPDGEGADRRGRPDQDAELGLDRGERVQRAQVAHLGRGAPVGLLLAQHVGHHVTRRRSMGWLTRGRSPDRRGVPRRSRPRGRCGSGPGRACGAAP